MKRRIIIAALTGLFSIGFVFAQTPTKTTSTATEKRFDYVRAVDVFGATIQTVEKNFVDSVSFDKMYKQGINAMLSSLDPYTEYFSADEAEELRLMRTGAYGGIGAIIQARPDSTVMIAQPMRGQPADLAGLKAGDVILEIDGKDFSSNVTNLEVSTALKGLPNSQIRLKIQRPGAKKTQSFTFKRQQIQMPPVSYYGVIPNTSVGYIMINGFTDKAAKQTGEGLAALQAEGITSLILDFRGNLGGLVEEAIKLISFFVPEGSEVVSLRGRDGNIMATYRTFGKPVAADIPLCILVNGESASASEIVAGALQDMDRGVVVGRKTFGKGLVQNTFQLPYDGVLKMTTAKYYIPSGRCIQRIDHHEGRATGQLKYFDESQQSTFYTAGGRAVKDAGGILPDIEVEPDTLAGMVYYLSLSTDVFDFITDYCQRHKTIADPEHFSINDDDYQRLGELLKEKKFTYDLRSTEYLTRLEEVAEIEGLIAEHDSIFVSLREALRPDLDRDLERFKPIITDYVNIQIIRRYYYDEGGIRYGLKADPDLKAALEILQDPARYQSILQIVSKEK